jgi:amino acid adenylation domain-containing protein
MSLDLPFDFQRVPGTTRQLRSHAFALPVGPNGDGLERLDRRALGMPEPSLSAAFGILLARYSGQTGISLRVCRGSAAAEGSSTRVLALDVGRTRTCREVLAQIRDFSDGAEQGSARIPLDSRYAGAGQAAILWLESEDDVSACRVDADLSLLITSGAEPRVAFLYDSSRFKASSIERFAGHLGVLLSGLGSNPDALVSELPLLRAEEQRWIESACDGSLRTLPPSFVHELIEQQAAAAPAAIAVRFREQSLTYGELNRRANQLARYLAQSKIGAGCRVLVCVEPAFDIVIALLGILKAGAVYVPLDPSYPPARIRAVLADTRPGLIITQDHLLARLPFGSEATLVLDGLPADDDALPAEAPVVEPSQIAYIYYTSGTTGSPKGIMASHANLLHYVRSAEQRYQIGQRDVMPAIARFSFSISLFELLSPLIAGGTLLLLEREHILDPARMAGTLAEVTIFHAGPSLLKGLLAYIRRHYPDSSAFSQVRHASSGGDMVPADLLEAMQVIFANAEIFVIYGSSEISCMGCTYPVPRGQRVTTSYVGKPFDNVAVRVLDGARNVLPAGIVGEIHFAGDGVIGGYLNRPELTAEKFVTIGGRRFYCTGDLGRLSEEGWLEILGRNDFQIKLRGMRVELAEVEYQLRRAPGVRDAVAAASEAGDQEKILVAYVVTERNETPEGAEKAARIAGIRRHMAQHLPDYMVPAVYVELDQLPVNHNMKVDRHALPKPTEADLRAGSGASLREPQTPTEKTLAALWRQLLGVERVGLDDNFFELGGHSMLAVMLSLEVQRALGIALEGMDILREPLAVLAAICERKLGISSPRAEVHVLGANAAPSLQICHFGADQSLYGVLHPRAFGAVSHAVLICGPVGQEHARARFVLTRLAKQLARQGIPSLSFDYFGCGDSLGDSADAGVGRWQTDIAQAHAELQRRTNAARVTAIGVRLGALLLCQAARRLELAKLVLWDPIRDGARYLAELAEMQRAYLRSTAPLRFWRWPRARPQARELLGSVYSEAAFRELEALALDPLLAEQRAPTRVWETLHVDCGWRDVGRLEDVIPDIGISSELARLVTEGQ